MYSHSKVNVYKMCPQLFKYKYINNLQPIGDKDYLIFGSLVHKGIQLDNITELLEFIEKNYSTSNDKTETTITLVMACVEAYFKKFGNKELKRNEVKFNFIFDSIEIEGYIDSLIETEEGYWVEEIKTAAYIDNTYLDKLKFNDQTNLYLYATINNYLENINLDKPILGVKYRIIKKPLLRQKKTEDVIQFRQRLVNKMLEDDNIIEITLKRSVEELNTAIEDFIYTAKEIESTTRYTKTLSACSTYGRCPFMELCAGTEGGENLYEQKIRKQF